jgi:hypothetical protein
MRDVEDTRREEGRLERAEVIHDALVAQLTGTVLRVDRHPLDGSIDRPAESRLPSRAAAKSNAGPLMFLKGVTPALMQVDTAKLAGRRGSHYAA